MSSTGSQRSHHQPAEAARPETTADELFPQVYEELRVLARRELARVGGGAGLTLSTTALVHESYLKLARSGRWGGRAQFFATAAKAMRHILVDHHRQRAASKRGGDVEKVTLQEADIVPAASPVDFVALDDAMRRLGARDPRLERVVECRFFGGMTVEETGEALQVSTRTVERDWTRAKAYLYSMLRPEPQTG
jgi:RNA polymerase sigma-70 factor, ECF subfamily